MSSTPVDLVGAVHRMGTGIRALAARIEDDRAVPEELTADLAALGVFRLAAPRAAGGLQADPGVLVEVCEELARADGSVGWCAMIAAGTGVALGYLAPEVAAALLTDPRFLIAGVAAPAGRAVAVPGGYRVTGRWPFASGCRQSTWLVGGCVLADGDGPVPAPAGGPIVLHAVLPAASVTIHDTWDVVGLRGTGSHDIEVADLFVPATHTFSLFGPPVVAEPLYTFPVWGLLSLGIGAVALGIGRAALDEFVELAGAKRDPLTGEPLATKPRVRAVLAEAEATLGAGRAYLRTEVEACWRVALAGGPVPLPQRARLRLAVHHATTSAARTVDLLFTAAGGSAIRSSGPLQRHLRDIHVVTQHAMVSADLLELAGGVLLDQPVPTVRL